MLTLAMNTMIKAAFLSTAKSEDSLKGFCGHQATFWVFFDIFLVGIPKIQVNSWYFLYKPKVEIYLAFGEEVMDFICILYFWEADSVV